jgi:hypothetical protein
MLANALGKSERQPRLADASHSIERQQAARGREQAGLQFLERLLAPKKL